MCTSGFAWANLGSLGIRVGESIAVSSIVRNLVKMRLFTPYPDIGLDGDNDWSALLFIITADK